jgi:hypothetical protein
VASGIKKNPLGNVALDPAHYRSRFCIAAVNTDTLRQFDSKSKRGPTNRIDEQ